MTTSASPWELSVSKIADESPEREQIVRAPFHAEPEAVLALHPMDFRTIEEKMKRGEYEGEKSVLFWSDLSLIVVNVFV